MRPSPGANRPAVAAFRTPCKARQGRTVFRARQSHRHEAVAKIGAGTPACCGERKVDRGAKAAYREPACGRSGYDQGSEAPRSAERHASNASRAARARTGEEPLISEAGASARIDVHARRRPAGVMATARFSIRRPKATLCVALRLPASGLLLQLVDALGRLGLRQVLVELLIGLLAQRAQIRALRAGHRFIAGSPLVGVLGRILPWRLISGCVACAAAQDDSLPGSSKRH